MRLSLTLSLLFLFTLNASCQWGFNKRIKGNGDVTTEERSVTDFKGVSTCCNIDAVLTPGRFSVEVEAESNLQEYIETRVVAGRLEIGFKSNYSIRNNRPITVRISLPELDYVAASSSGSIRGRGTFSGDELEADVSSGAEIELAFEGERAMLEASSGGGVELSGRVDRVRANASSGGRVRAGDLTARRVNADVSSGAGITVRAAEEIRADASSGGRVRYHGNPGTVDADTSSGGSVKRAN